MSNIPSPPPDPPPPDEAGITLQANNINVSGDVIKRDKITNNITNNITNTITKFFLGGAAEERDRRNRRIMLEKVRTFWVKGVLEKSLHGAALIELGMEYKPDAVQYPWNTVLQRHDHSPQPLPHGAKMIEIFDQEVGELLILGAPGSGKTTMLIDLARDLIARAEQDETLPIPVVFNLSSWAEKHPPLVEWLIEELSFRYDVPKKVGKAWIEKDQVLPLLDGLDEVKLEQRAACVEAINNFRKEHLVQIAVCSRSAEYEALDAQLRLHSAIVLQPLTREQVDTYVESAGEHLASVRALLQRDTALQELAESPLMLSILVLAYRDLDMSDLPTLDSLGKQRQHVFDQYIQRMFERRGADERYTPQQVTHWLSWLARRMVEHSQTTFYLERMQPAWLPVRFGGVYAIATCLIVGLVYGLVIWLVNRLDNGLVNELDVWLVYGLVGGLINSLVFGLVNGMVVRLDKKIGAVETLRWSWRTGLFGGLIVGLVNGLFFGLVRWLLDGLVYGMIGGLFGGLVIGLDKKKIEAVETLRWSWRDAKGRLLFGGVIIGIFFGLFVPLLFSELVVSWLASWLASGLLYGMVGGLFGGMVGGLRVGGEIETKTIPNQGIWRSAQNAILSGLFVGLVFAVVFAVVSYLVFGLLGLRFVGPLHGPSNILPFGLFFGLFIGLFFGSFVGLLYGGFVCIQHFTLRLMLYLNGSLPLNYVHFLDYCAERIFLRKVGGGYIFVHRLLMEHFAEIESLKH